MTQQRIAIAARKGGVGKTTIACGLASVMANQGKQVLVIDLDPQSNAAYVLGTNPTAPGAFAFAEPNYVKEILQTAGFQDITVSPWQHNLLIGGSNPSPESTAEFLLKATSLGQLPEDLPNTVKIAIHSELSNRLKAYETRDGVQMPASVWLVNAKA
jgi:cellulose biosynthesis protein BcsQ